MIDARLLGRRAIRRAARSGSTVIFTDPSLRSMALFLRFWISFMPMASTKISPSHRRRFARYAICRILAIVFLPSDCFASRSPASGIKPKRPDAKRKALRSNHASIRHRKLYRPKSRIARIASSGRPDGCVATPASFTSPTKIE